ncbi:hypothetical protein RB2083_1929 [Rhodobacteraceae bacterium HTCC2083]|nr:hypothetical protein RB2083_1929 [Rhodobacteraceae bacterium HTCC2083]
MASILASASAISAAVASGKSGPMNEGAVSCLAITWATLLSNSTAGNRQPSLFFAPLLLINRCET